MVEYSAEFQAVVLKNKTKTNLQELLYDEKYLSKQENKNKVHGLTE